MRRHGIEMMFSEIILIGQHLIPQPIGIQVGLVLEHGGIVELIRTEMIGRIEEC